MRSVVLALTFALLMFALGRLTRANDEMEVAGFVTATDQEAAEGYFAVGDDAMLVVKQGSGLHGWLRSHTGQRIRLVLANGGRVE